MLDWLRKKIRNDERWLAKGGLIINTGIEITPDKSNLLEIKLKDIDSVPEVWYQGKRLDKFPNGLVSIDYRWKTKGHNECYKGTNELDVEWVGEQKAGFRS